MKASEYKKLKGLRKESLRDNMTDIEVALTDLGEVATRELAKKHITFYWITKVNLSVVIGESGTYLGHTHSNL